MSIFTEKSFSDEAHFHLGENVNKQNCRIWGSKNPHVIMEKPMHPQRVTVWCGFWSGSIIGPFFFENEQGAVVTVNGERYRAMLNEFLLPKFEEEDICFNRTTHLATQPTLQSIFAHCLRKLHNQPKC